MRTTPTIHIDLNGSPRACAQGSTVAQLVLDLGFRPEVVAIELNQALVPRAERERRVLVEGDRVEVVTLVGGG